MVIGFPVPIIAGVCEEWSSEIVVEYTSVPSSILRLSFLNRYP